MITTEEVWSIDGVPLNTLAFNISSLGGSRLGVPGMRGGNVTVPYRPGDMWVPKMPSSRVITLGMWVKGADEDGRVPQDFRGQFTHNWLRLKQLFWNTGRQMELTKRIRRMDGSFIEATAMVEYGGGLEPEMLSPGMASFTVDLILADPFFYGVNSYTWEIPAPEPQPDAEGQLPPPQTYYNPGHDVARFMTLQFDGGSNYVLTNTVLGITLSLPGVSGEASLDTKNFTARSAGTPILDKVKVSGPHGVPYWMLLARGENLFEYSGGGSVKIKYNPVYT